MDRVLKNLVFLGVLAQLFSAAPAAGQSVFNFQPKPRDAGFANSALLVASDDPWSDDAASKAGFSVAPLDLTVPVPLHNPADNFYVLAVLSDPSTTNPHDRPSSAATKFHWWPSFGESMLFTGIMHTFNIVTEPGTRDALNGPLLKDYLDSVSELRGWSDNDKFMAPYVGHPIEGSVFGFIERQNDPRYKQVQYGDGRDYWLSLLKSMAFSAAWHTQWKIGPLSEASIGNVMLHASPGFITLVDTPTLGFCTMLAEDAADRYIIVGL